MLESAPRCRPRTALILLAVTVFFRTLPAHADNWQPVQTGGPVPGEEKIRVDVDSVFRDAGTGFVALRTAVDDGAVKVIILKAIDCERGMLYLVGDWPKGLEGPFAPRAGWKTSPKYRVEIGGQYDIKSDAALAQRYCPQRDKLPIGKLE